MKKCFKCLTEKPISEFYKHKAMADGHLNKCKCCTKRDVLGHRLLNLEKIREYDRDRGARQPPEYLREYRSKYPRKFAAHQAVNSAIKLGVLVQQNCEECGTDESLHAHHDDYSRQLDVRWLCAACHKKWHLANGEGLNGN